MRTDMRGARHLVCHCADVRAGERALIVHDHATGAVAQIVATAVRGERARTDLIEIAPFAIHGQEPSRHVADAMCRADVVFGLTTQSMAHTRACRQASRSGVRYLSLPEYSEEVLAGPAMRTNFRGLTKLALRLADVFTASRSIRLTSRAGTDVTFDVSDRVGNAAPGWCDGPGTLASPPDAESNVALVEDSAEGLLVVDGSVTCAELGVLSAPLKLRLTAGRVCSVEGEPAAAYDAAIGRAVEPAGRVVAELGVGLNPLASLGGTMLENEGALGTVHVGVGANATIGGASRVPFHVDHVLRTPTLEVDGRAIMLDGNLLAGR